MTERQAKQLRLENSIRYLYNRELTEQEEEQRQLDIIGVLEDSGNAYSRGHFLTALRRQGVIVSQRSLRPLIKSVDPLRVQSREPGRIRRKGKIEITGPGRVYSTDGYNKLKLFGFEIYSYIDGYSRNIR